MTILEMLEQSAILTVLGMVIVFVFLWLLIVCVTLAGRLINRFALDKESQIQKSTDAALQNNAPDAEITAVITAAVAEYRKARSSGGG
jgi:oxaloacetate decarboxylase gamma subunit